MALLDGTDARALDQAAALLAAGELVAFPTETVYGLGARADDDRVARQRHVGRELAAAHEGAFGDAASAEVHEIAAALVHGVVPRAPVLIVGPS